MKYREDVETSLLEILENYNSQHGVFFARWEEIRELNYAESFLRSIEGAPDLNGESEYHLEQMESAGLVEELDSWSTKEGRQFRITRYGHDLLGETRHQRSVFGTTRRWIVWVSGLIFALLAAFWMLASEVIAPSKYCPLIPGTIAAFLAPCERTLGGANP